MNQTKIKSMDNHCISRALNYENDGVILKFSKEYNISKAMSEEYFLEVKKFLYLCSIREESLAPSNEIDKIWHSFILFTKDYRMYCQNYLGKFIDHIPNIGQVSSRNPVGEKDYLRNTIRAYLSVFGDMNNNIWGIEQRVVFKSGWISDINELQLSGSQDCIHEEDDGMQPSCVFHGTCFTCSDSGYNCIGENPNDIQ